MVNKKFDPGDCQMHEKHESLIERNDRDIKELGSRLLVVSNCATKKISFSLFRWVMATLISLIIAITMFLNHRLDVLGQEIKQQNERSQAKFEKMATDIEVIKIKLTRSKKP